MNEMIMVTGFIASVITIVDAIVRIAKRFM